MITYIFNGRKMQNKNFCGKTCENNDSLTGTQKMA